MAGLGVFTDLYRKKYAQIAEDGNALNGLKLEYFQIGEAGLFAGENPPPPDPTFSALVATVELPSSDSSHRFYQKSLLSGDVSVAGDVLTVVCELQSAEGNDTPDLHYFELGIFDEDDDMIAYCTFDDQLKDSNKSLKNTVNIVF